MDYPTVCDAIERILKDSFHGCPVYFDQLPKDFQRPSFTMELQKDSMVDMNRCLVKKSITVLITCFVEVNAYHDSSRKALNQVQNDVMHLLGKGYLRVENTTVYTETLKGECAPDFAEVSITANWADIRPGYRDPDDKDDPDNPTLLMENFAINGA